MTLEHIVEKLDETSNDLTICLSQTPRWSANSEAELCHADQVNQARLPYFLEVAVAKNVIRAWSYARNGKNPTLLEKCEALIYYAENDAYLLPGSNAP